MQTGANILWEIKTDRYDTYSDFLQQQVIKNQVVELKSELKAAQACGYGFIVGVSRAAHRTALLRLEPGLQIIVTGC